MHLNGLLQPESIAVVGASERPGPGHRIVKNLMTVGFPGEVYPVNPKYNQVLGLKCFPSIKDIPSDVDCLISAVASRHTMTVLKDGAEKGIRAAILLASGFAELGEEGRALQQAVEEFARQTDIAVCGPNCLGILNMHSRIAAYSGPLPERLVAGQLGVVFQSGALACTLTGACDERGIGFSYLISSGNEAGIEASQYIEYLINDPNTAVIASYVEGFKDGRNFVRVAELAAQKQKPIIMLKAGRSEKGRGAILAHTGALAGSELVHRAVFRQKGIITVSDLDELIENVELFLRARRPHGDGVSLITISGGETCLLSDIAADLGLELPDLSPATKEKLAKVLPAFVTLRNPLDSTDPGLVDRDVEAYTRCLEALAQDEHIGVVIISEDARNGLQKSAGRNLILQDAASAAVRATATTDKPVVVLSMTSGFLDQIALETLHASGLPLLQGAREGLGAVRNLIEYSHFLQRRSSSSDTQSLQISVDLAAIRSELRESKGVMVERESKALLSRYGIPVTREGLATSVEEAVEVARNLGFPVALKVESPGLTHKSESGAIELNVPDVHAVESSYWKVLESARRYAPGAAIHGVLVQEMVPKGVEVIVGLKQDPHFGPVVLFGLGGILVEVLRDFSLRPAPLARRDAEEMIREVRGYKILEGVRGSLPADVEGIIDVLFRLSQLGIDLRDEVAEVDINPLLVLEDGLGVKVVDALVVLKESGRY
ncbi:MAG: acetate--CoA ligase family protein [Chloroflexi bacterium]|nr:acetate--CoA ligase family protein [Chloroflexota bacterium]MCL5076179.1 acetate--CoA ligase family protein [Chloroflexota bacterium]